MTNFILQHRMACYGFGIGLSTSLVFLLSYKLIASFIISSVITLLIAILFFVLIYRYELPKFRQHVLIVLSGLSFECLTILFTLPYPQIALPTVTTFMMTYIAIFMTTILLIVSLYMALWFLRKTASL